MFEIFGRGRPPAHPPEEPQKTHNGSSENFKYLWLGVSNRYQALFNQPNQRSL